MTIKIDKFDKHILDKLQHDASLTNLELADAVGLSPTPCGRRVKILEDAGVIQKRVAILAREALNLNLTVMLSISLDSHSAECIQHFSDEIKMFPEVIECHLVTGQTYDFILKAVVADMKSYEQLLLNKITSIEGVNGVHSSFVLREVISKTQYSLDYIY